MTASAPPHQTRLAGVPLSPAGTEPLPLRLDSTRRLPDGSVELASTAKASSTNLYQRTLIKIR